MGEASYEQENDSSESEQPGPPPASFGTMCHPSCGAFLCTLPLSRLTKVDRVPLIILDDTFARAPWRFVHVAHERDPVLPQVVRRRRHVSRLEVEMEVLASLDVRNRGIYLVDEFQMNHLTACPNAGVEVFVLELEPEPQLRGIESNRFREIGCPELYDNIGNLHVDLRLFGSR